MVTYEALFAYTVAITSTVSLVLQLIELIIQISNKKK